MASTAWHRAHTKPCLGCGKPVQARKRETSTGRCKRCWDRPKTLVPCPRCSKEFWPWANGKHARKTCGCKAHPKVKPKVKPVIQPKSCGWCRADFVPARTAAQRFCSPGCVRAATSQRKHIRRRGLRRKQDQVPLQEIYDRDRGQCGLCHGRVAPDFEATRKSLPHAPVLDHIVPISKGGKHERSNLQLAHFRCNTIKGNRMCRSQMRLPLEVEGGGRDVNHPAA